MSLLDPPLTGQQADSAGTTAGDAPRPAPAGNVLLLTPSSGLGGGIERYLATVQAALTADGARVRRVDLLSSAETLTPSGRLSFLARSAAAARRRPDVVIAAHPNLAPLAAAARFRGSRSLLFCYGSDIWGMKGSSRRTIRTFHRIQPVTISSFSAGALAAVGVSAAVLSPTVDPEWRTTLLGVRRRDPHPGPPRLLTVFRLSEWRSKGLPNLLEAIERLRLQGREVRLDVAGRGPVPADLNDAVAGRVDVTVHASPDDRGLARLYADADLTVLCTRTRTTPPYCGEGFGLVLLEAQLTGCPVVGPASGGSREAYLPGVSGWAPADESVPALAGVLSDALARPHVLAAAGEAGRDWACRASDPARYAALVRTVVFGPRI